jgi:hypothetical protein
MNSASEKRIERPSDAGVRRAGLFLILFCSAISLAWGWFGLSRTGLTDFRAVYYGTRCLIANHNPYQVSVFEKVYRAEGGQRPSETVADHQAVTLFVNLPTTCVVIAPLALLPWGPAHLIWMLATAAVFILAILLMWNLGTRRAPGVATFLACLLAANCEVVFGGGNTAGIVVGLCVLAVWCFIEERFVLAGVVVLGVALAMKPHDAGLVWLYFLAAGAPYRKRALQAMVIPVAVGLAALIWMGHVAPHWVSDWHANMATISGHGGINNPAPDSMTGRTSGMVIDLQAAISVFRDDPAFYNPASYCVCGVLLLLWLATTMRLGFSRQRAWLALASVTALTLLVTYHRPWDGKLLLLAIPACCQLGAEGGRVGRMGLALTSLALMSTGDLALAILSAFSGALHVGTAGVFEQMLTVVLIRPASIALLAFGVFYLWLYTRSGTAFGGLTKTGKQSKVALALDAAARPALAERQI